MRTTYKERGMRYFSMFSGVGGFELGIQRAFSGYGEQQADAEIGAEEDSVSTQVKQPNKPTQRRNDTCIGYSEIDKYAIETYENNWKGHTNYGDATKIDERGLPDFDLLVGGFPCQAFSVAGKRHGFNDTRGTLFFDIARILSHKRPRHLVLENVKGLLSHDSGKTFTTILGVLADLGYFVEWQVLNSKDFGVPQNRERVIIVGHLGGEPRRKVFPITGQGNKNTTFGKSTKTTVARTLTAGGHSGGNHSGMTIISSTNRRTEWSESDISNTLTSHYRGYPDGDGRPAVIIKQLNQPTHSNDRVYAEDGISPTLNTMQGGARIRRLTPTECERLMSWPDNWTIGSDTQRYKQCGNGVVSNVVQAVVEKLNKTCSL